MIIYLINNYLFINKSLSVTNFLKAYIIIGITYEIKDIYCDQVTPHALNFKLTEKQNKRQSLEYQYLIYFS